MTGVRDELEAFFRRLKRHSNMRWWVGPRPQGGRTKVLRSVAGSLGYGWPLTPDGRPAPLIDLDRAAAAKMLAMTATQSQAHEFNRPVRAQVKAEVAAVLARMGDEAVFVTNTEFHPHGRSGWPMSRATFDAGVIGFDRETAFIFWAEEED